MQSVQKFALLPLILGLSLAWVPSVLAHSHEAPGEHVNEFAQHLDDYAADVVKLSEALDGIAGEYAAERDVQDDLKAFIDLWEEVEVHEAVETVAMPLYPPIWVAISAMQQAANEKASVRDFVTTTRGVKAALHEGMGGVRLAAAQLEQGGVASAEAQQHERLDSRAEVQAIKQALDDAQAAYADGDTEQAKQLIQAAYLQRFEYLEGDLIAQDADLVSTLEKEFNVDLPVLINSGKPEGEVAALVGQMKSRLDRCAELLANAEKSRSEVF